MFPGVVTRVARQHIGSKLILECIQGNIAAQEDMDAVVNAANAELLPGGGVAGAIHQAAGPGLERETRALAPIRPGEAVITGAHRLPNRFVVHCLGPVYGRDEPSDELLANCYRNALRLADERDIASIAFPAISTGAFMFPIDEAARISIATVSEVASRLEKIELIRFVLYDADDLSVYERELEQVA